MSDFAKALAALRADLPPIRKTTRGQHGKYADYRAIKAKVDPVLTKHGFLWTTRPTLTSYESESGIELRFVLLYSLALVATGEELAGRFPLAEMDPQRQGSQISYAKRYALCAVLDLAPEGEDDDGMAASKPERTRTRTTGPDHERLRNGTVEPTPEDRPAERTHSPSVDMWTDNTSGEFDIGQPEDRPGSVDARQLKQLGIEFTKAGIADRGVRLGIVSDLIGRQIITSKQLSRLEAEHVIAHVRQQQEGTTDA